MRRYRNKQVTQQQLMEQLTSHTSFQHEPGLYKSTMRARGPQAAGHMLRKQLFNSHCRVLRAHSSKQRRDKMAEVKYGQRRKSLQNGPSLDN